MDSPSTALIDDFYLDKYERDGVVRIPNVFSKDEIDHLRASVWSSFRESDESDIQWKGVFPALMFWPERLVYSYAKDTRIASIARSFLGDDILQLNSQVYFRLPGDGDQFAWHQDISFRVPAENFAKIETGYLQTAIVIDEMSLMNSPIQFVPGSHKMGELSLVPRDGKEKGLREFKNEIFKGEKFYAKPGDVIVWSVMVVHGSGPNESNLSRMYYMNGFAKSECLKDQLKYPVYMRNGKLV